MKGTERGEGDREGRRGEWGDDEGIEESARDAEIEEEDDEDVNDEAA